MTVNNEEAFSSQNTQKKNFLSPQRESNPWPSRYQLNALTTELWETRGEQGHILERPTGIWKVMGSTPVGDSENSFSEYFDLRTLLHYLHFIQVTNPFINNDSNRNNKQLLDEVFVIPGIIKVEVFTLLSVPSKVFCRILLMGIDSAIDSLKPREEQAGFRKGRGCIEQISAFRNILEQC